MRWPSRRAPYALIGSLLLHGAAVAWLALHRPPPPKPPENAPIVMEIAEPKAAANTAPPPDLPKPAEPEKKAPAKSHSHVAHAPSGPAPSAPSTPVPSLHIDSSAPAVATAPAVPPSEAPKKQVPDLAAAGTAAADRVAQQALKLDRPPTLQQPDDRSIQAPFMVEDKDERVAGMLREALGRDRVERGMVDPYFRDMGHAMANAWKPEKLVDEKGMKGFLDEMGRGLRDGAAQWMTAWQQAAEAYGKSGNPGYDGNPFDFDGRLRDNIPAGVSTATPTQLNSSRIALVRLTQRPDGQLLHVELVQPSIDPVMDTEILRELRAGEMVMPVPPLKGAGIHNPIRSIWAFQLTVSIAPPVPMVSGSFDLDALFDKKMRQEMGGIVDVRLPLSRRITKRVDLVSVE